MRHVQLVLMSQFNSYLMHHGVTVVDIHKSMDKMYKVRSLGRRFLWPDSNEPYFQLQILEDLRQENDWIRSVISRAYQYHRYMLLDFEVRLCFFTTPHLWLTIYVHLSLISV
jgi:hypothetical protein